MKIKHKVKHEVNQNLTDEMPVQLRCKLAHIFYSMLSAAGRIRAVKDSETQTFLKKGYWLLNCKDTENTDWLMSVEMYIWFSAFKMWFVIHTLLCGYI